MNLTLTLEELQFSRAQRMAALTDAIAFNFALCAQLIAVISAAQQPGLIPVNSNDLFKISICFGST
jgi:hypothetical protein